MDGVLYCERSYWYSRPGPGEEDYPFPAPFDTGFYLILNVAVGGSFTGGLIDEVIFRILKILFYPPTQISSSINLSVVFSGWGEGGRNRLVLALVAHDH